MKSVKTICAVLSAALIFSSCSTWSNLAKGTTIGAASGAAGGALIGALIGKFTGNTGVGTAVGAGGGLVKSIWDKGNDVEIPANASVDLVFLQPITISAN